MSPFKLSARIIIPLLFLIVKLNKTTTGQAIFPASSLSINYGEGFLFYLQLPTTFIIRECLLTYNTQTIPLNPTFPETIENPLVSETIQSLGSNKCGARVHNVTDSSTAAWLLQAESLNDEFPSISGTLRLSILNSQVATVISSISGLANHFGTLHCPGDVNHQRFCLITDPQGKVTTTCELGIKFPPLNTGPQIYQCQVLFWGRVSPVHSEIHVSSVPTSPRIHGTITETTDHVLLACDFNESVSICRAEHLATGNEYLVMDGFQSRRYSTWNTQLASGRCELELPEPLAANETGVWRMHGKLQSSNAWTGCLFHVRVSGLEVMQEFTNKLQKETEAAVSLLNLIETSDEMIDLQCPHVPYPLDYCYLRTPTHEIILPTAREMDLFRAYGICTFKRVAVVTGRYTCGFNGEGGDVNDLLQYVDVQYSDPRVFLATSEQVVSVVDDDQPSLVLMCYALQGYSISTCTFVAPAGGEVYHLSPENSNSRFAYRGGGFDAGDCGMEVKIGDKAENMLGNWTCSVDLVDGYGKYSVEIVVERRISEEVTENLTAGAIAGIAVAGVVVIIALGGLGIVYWRRMRRSTGEISS